MQTQGATYICATQLRMAKWFSCCISQTKQYQGVLVRQMSSGALKMGYTKAVTKIIHILKNTSEPMNSGFEPYTSGGSVDNSESSDDSSSETSNDSD